MEILRDDEVPGGMGFQTYRETAWDSLFFGLLLSAATVGVGALPFVSGRWATLWIDLACGFGVLFFGLMASIGIKGFRASRRPEAWLARHSPDTLFLRFRSCHNWRFPSNTPAVVRIDRREISWLRLHTKRLSLPGDQDAWTSETRLRALDIHLGTVDLEPLKKALSEEAKRRDRRGVRTNDYPVTFSGSSTLRLALRRPSALLAQLSSGYRVLAEEQSGGTSFSDMSRTEQEAHVLDLVQSGNKIAAIAAARELYGYDLAGAKKFVEELAEG